MATPEEFLVKLTEDKAKGEELKRRIVRAQSWDQLFATTEEAEEDFQRNLVDAWRFYYSKDDSSVQYFVEPHLDGDIHRIVRPDSSSIYQRLLNGDVVLTFYLPDKPPSVNLITPWIGNINHPFTAVDVIIQDDVIDSLIEDQNSGLDSVHLAFLISHLKGKPATQGWEDTMLHNGYMPQRIGYRLFPGYAIEELAKLRAKYPQISPKTY